MNLSFFKQKKFGLPVWAWGVISAVIIFGIYYYIKKRNANSSNSTTSPSTAATDSSNLPLSTLPYGYGDGSGGFGGSGSYTGWSPQTPPNQSPLIVEIQQTPPTNPTSTHTTPPKSPGVSTLAGSNALLESIFTPGTSPYAPTTGAGSQSSTPGGDSANKTQGVFATDSGGGLVNAPKIQTQPPVKTTTVKTIPNAYSNPNTKANIH